MLPVTDADGERGVREVDGDRGRCGRLHPELFETAELSARVRSLPASSATTTRSWPRQWSCAAQPDARGASANTGRGARAAGGCSGSSRPSSPTRWSPRATSRSAKPPPEARMLFVDLRGWTSFVDSVEPEELMRVPASSTRRSAASCGIEAIVGFLKGDGISSSSTTRSRSRPPLRVVRLACALREEMAELTRDGGKRGDDLDFGVGIVLGYATCGEVGFEGDRRRSDWGGDESCVAARGRGDGWADLIAQRSCAEVEDDVEVELVGELTLKGLPRARRVRRPRPSRADRGGTGVGRAARSRGDGISPVVLSVCTSTSGRSSSMLAPSAASHRAISASVTPPPDGASSDVEAPRARVARSAAAQEEPRRRRRQGDRRARRT